MIHSRLFLALATLLMASCVTTTYTGHSFDEPFSLETAADHIQKAEAEIAAGETEVALDRLIELHQTPSIDPADRKVAGQLLNDTCVKLIDQLVEEEHPSRLKRIFNLDLPPRLRVEAGIAAARAYLNDSERVKCFKMVRKVEQKFPMHHLRMQAGDLLLEAGLSLAADDSVWFLFFSPAKDRALETLDFLVLNYPFHPGCDQAYQALAILYEDADWQERAIRNYEDLVAFQPDSPLAPEAEARIPLLRLAQMERADNDRSEMLRARDEAAAWLERHPAHPLEEPVRGVLDQAERMLVQNDLVNARFYLRVEEPFGAHLYAKRALEEAEIADADDLAAEATELIAQADALGPAEPDEATP
jgi:hypothetical protein